MINRCLVGVAGGTMIALALTAGGCRVGQTMRGEPMVGVALGQVDEALSDAGAGAVAALEHAGGLLPFPYDIVAGGAAAALAHLLGQNRGRRRGWDQREQQQSRIDLAWEESAARAARSEPATAGA